MSDYTPQIPPQFRRDYTRGELLESQALPDPVEQFRLWFADAAGAGVAEPNAMTLATATCDGVPSARVVLLKGFDARGFVFYTNYTSRKARELDANPAASLCFFWQPLERQVRISGRVERVTQEESAAYFHARPTEAQIGAWASKQSRVIVGRDELERRNAELTAKFAGEVIPLPDFWGGYRVVPSEIEFWQGRPSRLHDRLLYVRDAEQWGIRRLSP
jgi:pyridoxamine 5'-phosphate oxidase